MTYVHIIALIGLLYVFFNTALLNKIFITHCILHSLGALGITAGAHRLWAHRAYEASKPWKFVVMLLNSGTKKYNHSYEIHIF